MRYLSCLFLLAALAACGDGVEEQLAANKSLVREFTEAQNNWDYDRLNELVAENLVRHSHSTPDVNVRSLEDFKDFLREWQVAMPDAHTRLNQLIAEGDRVATHATFTGTQTGPMNGIEPTGTAVESNFIGILRVEDGKIAETWVEWDNLHIMHQLGLLQPPSEDPEM